MLAVIFVLSVVAALVLVVVCVVVFVVVSVVVVLVVLIVFTFSHDNQILPYLRFNHIMVQTTRKYSSLTKLVIFFYIFGYNPGALQPFFKDDKVARLEFSLTAVVSHFDFSFD